MIEAKLSAYPIFPLDPACSLWSFSQELYASDIASWTGADKPIFGNLNVDGICKRFMGTMGAKEVIEQKSVKVSACSTEYLFEDETVRLTLRFTVPALPLDRPPLPVAFLEFELESADGKPHEAEVLVDFSEKLTFTHNRKWTWGGVLPFPEGKMGYIGRFYQFPLWTAGDRRDCESGWFYLAGDANVMVTGVDAMRRYFRKLELKETDTYRKLLCAHRKLKIGGEGKECFALTFAYDGVYSFNYFGESCKGAWKNDYYDMVNAIRDVITHRAEIAKRCAAFDESLEKDCEPFGENYLTAAILGYRLGAIAGKEGLRGEERIYATKAQGLGGYACMLEHLYRAAPFFLYYFPEQLKRALLPLFDYARMKSWRFSFAPADAGLYPFVTGQAEGLKAGYLKTTRKLLKLHPYQHTRIAIYKEEEQTPFRNCAEALILSYAYFLESFDYQFIRENADLLSKWGEYLSEEWSESKHGDNADESLLRALGLAAWGKLLGEIRPGEETGGKFFAEAKQAAMKLETVATPGEGMLSRIRDRKSWSLKSDLVWDDALGFHLFGRELKERETRFYGANWGKYGVGQSSSNMRVAPDRLIGAMALGRAADCAKAAEAYAEVLKKESEEGIPGSFDAATGEGSEPFAATLSGVFMPLYLKRCLEKKENER